jgi:hypothetical protein
MVLAMVSVSLQAEEVRLDRQADRVVVTLDSELFTEYRLDQRRPCFFPVIGPTGEHMSRRWPLDSTIAAMESQDHPHHTGLFFAHGNVRVEGEEQSSDFWHHASVELEEFVDFESNADVGRLVARHVWKREDGSELCRDLTTIAFGGESDSRWIDFTITIQAPASKGILMGDTKEGTFAIRVPESLTIQAHSKKLRHLSTGKIETSEGLSGRKAWGTRAKWCAFYGQTASGGTTISIFDHPDNPRHPTWWMARHYGLFAANATGQSYFEKKSKGSGDLLIPAGESVSFHYRINFMASGFSRDVIEAQYVDWVEHPKIDS